MGAAVTRSAGWSAMADPSAGPDGRASQPPDIRLMRVVAMAVSVLAVLLLLALGLTWLLRKGDFPFERVLLEAEPQRTSVATIRANAFTRIQGDFFTIDLQAAQRAFESVPWVRTAEVRRHWPGQLRVRLHEHRAVALWESVEAPESRDDRLVGEDGSVFQANPGDVEDEQLPVLRGPQGSSAQMWAMYRPLSQALGAVGRLGGSRQAASIRVLGLSSKGSWTAELDTGARIELGRGTHSEVLARAQVFARTLPQAVAPHGRPLLHADLRHPQGYAIRLAGVTTTAAEASAPAARPGRPSGRPQP